jgi:hypothetical protein
MMAGGHFLSDVIWAAGMTWLVALALHRWLRPEDEPAPAPPADPARERGKARLVTVVGGLALAGLTAAALVATPYLSQKTWRRSAAEVAASPAPAFTVTLGQATVALEAGQDLEASYDVAAFGFPTSRLNWSFAEGPAGARLSIDQHGVFSERRTAVKLRWPADGPRPLRVEVERGKVALDLSGFGPGARLEVVVGEGQVRVKGGAALRDGRATVRVGRGEVIEEDGPARAP